MSITYEDALSTLEAMFGTTWTKEELGELLRHEKGHMERTCEIIIANDGVPPRQGKGTPTTLPPDFLRIPDYGGVGGLNHPSASGRPGPQSGSPPSASPPQTSQMREDEALARMLQNELFVAELQNNPEFRHLAGPGGGGGRTQHPGHARTRDLTSDQGRQRGGSGEGRSMTESLSNMGGEAKRSRSAAHVPSLMARWCRQGRAPRDWIGAEGSYGEEQRTVKCYRGIGVDENGDVVDSEKAGGVN
ncbi:hypothetical protein TrRE_jg10359 [Triparma retinervis]|uniref:CUE domain-containing protein n=1 Tax=Triparma retinervis TaxID=2557542 RepID=A0A9W7DQB6_9STRA|nr:hypothetical protein TrRE_jg10359 [Triparma retinervis]